MTNGSVFNAVIKDEPRRKNGETSFFLDESRFCLQHQDGRIRVWKNRGERTLPLCIRHCHILPSPGMMA
ncbi:hypothetical protein TNCV_3703011 [Trichonephila clavipes]|nr:hypothetical protein TNCV_3703011 [Trichonephila clavipes]